MYIKQYFDYESKIIFVLFIVISFVLHLVLVLSSSRFSKIIKPEIDLNDYVSNDAGNTIEIEFQTTKREKETAEEEKLKEEEKKTNEELLKKRKRQLFVDTSGNTIDETPQEETTKIGEKGSIARDMYQGKDNINNKPRLTTDAEMYTEAPEDLSAVKPSVPSIPVNIPYVEPIENITQEENNNLTKTENFESTLDNNSEITPMNNETDKTLKPENEFVVQDAKPDDVIDTYSKANEIKTDEKKPLSKIDEITQDETFGEVELFEKVESFENQERETPFTEESTDKIAEQVKEYTTTASLPVDRIKELVEGGKENRLNKPQKQITKTEHQIYNIPHDDNAPFFEDSISNTPTYGKESFNVKRHEYAPYYKHVREKISWYWFLQYGTDAAINLVTKGYRPVIVQFKIIPSGKIVNVEIKDSAGNDLLASKIQSSIQNTRLDKFPDYVNENYINVRFNFYFF